MYKRIIKDITSLLLIIIGTIIFTEVLNSRDKLYFCIFYSLFLFSFYKIVKNKLIINSVSIISLLILFSQIIIIPYSFYMVWLEHIKLSIPQGKISNLINYIIIFLWVFFICDFIKNGKKMNIIMVFSSISLLFSLFFNNIYIPLIFLFSLISIIFINIIKNKSYDKLISVLSVILVICFISVKTKNNSITHSVIVENISYNLRKIIVQNFPKIDLLTTIPGMSDQFRNNKGKPPILTNNDLLKIKGNPGEVYYLRMSVGYKNSEFKLIDRINKPVNTTRKIKLTVLSDFLPIMPTTIDTAASNIYELSETSDFTYKIDVPLPKNSEFYLIKNENNNTLDYIDDTLFESCPRLEELASSLKGTSDLITARNIKNYLLNNYTYSLETKPSDKYISEFLFESKEGFCVHFTRAFILLARLNKLKCREISGYAVQIPRRPINSNLDYGEEIITGKNSHLWPEVYLEGNWQTFEVTPLYFQETKEIDPEIIIPTLSESIIEMSDVKKFNTIFVILPIIILLLVITIIFKYLRMNIISKLVKLSGKKKIPHPKDIGWLQWNELFLKNDKYIDIILEVNYSNRSYTKQEKKELRNIYVKLR